jgi:hypothetical protein
MLIPKKFSTNLPNKVDKINTIATVILAVLAILADSCLVTFPVKLTNMGIIPTGFTIANRAVNIFIYSVQPIIFLPVMLSSFCG